MCGCCTSDSLSYRTKYKEKQKGICTSHQHMLVYSNFYWRDFIDKELFCNNCNSSLGNCGFFRCRTCNYNLCPRCFDDIGGEIANKFQVNQKGQINKHPHILEYKNLIVRNIPITARPSFICKICGGHFLMEYVDAWNCPRCGYDYCDKCFSENGGIII